MPKTTTVPSCLPSCMRLFLVSPFPRLHTLEVLSASGTWIQRPLCAVKSTPTFMWNTRRARTPSTGAHTWTPYYKSAKSISGVSLTQPQILSGGASGPRDQKSGQCWLESQTGMGQTQLKTPAHCVQRDPAFGNAALHPVTHPSPDSPFQRLSNHTLRTYLSTRNKC